MSLNIALVYDLKDDWEKHEPTDMTPEDLQEFDDEGVIAGLCLAIQDLGHKPIRVGNVFALVQALASNAHEHQSWDLVWNAAEGYHGTAREAQVPGILEAWQIPFVFSNAATLAAVHDKALTKIMLAHRGVATTPFLTIQQQDEVEDLTTFKEWRKMLSPSIDIFSPEMPALFVKPNMEGSSKGIYACNKVQSVEELNGTLRFLRQRFPSQDLIVEPFLHGREFTVSLLGSGRDARVIGAIEFKFMPGKTDFLGLDMKDGKVWLDIIHGTEDSSDPHIIAAKSLALDAWRAMGCHDAGRVDIRYQGFGDQAKPFVLEVWLESRVM